MQVRNTIRFVFIHYNQVPALIELARPAYSAPLRLRQFLYHVHSLADQYRTPAAALIWRSLPFGGHACRAHVIVFSVWVDGTRRVSFCIAHKIKCKV